MDESLELRTSDGTCLRGKRNGPVDAPYSAVFCHGYAMDMRTWDRYLEAVPAITGDRACAIAYDHRGHGGSDPVRPGTATIEQLGDDLAELVAARASGRLLLVGHSVGGLALLAFAERHPATFRERVAGAMLLATPVLLRSESALTWPKAAGRVVQELEHVFGSLLVRQVRKRIDPAKTAAMRWWLYGEHADAQDVRLTADMVNGNWPDTIATFSPTLRAKDRTAALQVASGIPLLAAVGEADRLVSVSDAQVLERHSASAELLTVPGVGHMLPLEAFAKLLPRVASMINSDARARDLRGP